MRTRAKPSRPRSTTGAVEIAAWRLLSTPSGDFAIAVDVAGRLRTGWPSSDFALPKGREQSDLKPALAKALTRYFDGKSVDFSDIELPDGTPFRRACWRLAREIPRGSTISYAELAERAGSPGAARAAGQSMRHNPTPILVPCHRVIGADGALHGFAGSCDSHDAALTLKGWLLALERETAPAPRGGPAR